MDEIKSCFDGWERQCYEVLLDGKGGYCAMGWLDRTNADVLTFDAIGRRIGGYIQQHYPLPEFYLHPRSGLLMQPRVGTWYAIIYANNVLKLTPEDFRRIDRESQIEQAVKPLLESVSEEVKDPNAFLGAVAQ